MTSLVILTSGVYHPELAQDMIESGAIPELYLGAPLVCECFRSVLGESGALLVSISLLLFAFTSLLGGGYCGLRGLETLTKSRWAKVGYHLLLPAFIILGSVADLKSVWEVVDLLSGLLAIPNLLALLLLSPEALWLLRGWQKETVSSYGNISSNSRCQIVSGPYWKPSASCLAA
ncbi:MAG: alanine:cation symporter family protein [Lachnospiraceae bacterium]|nr:alanine:cation symporter family protein [Lachnospiraceae bacterium]